MAYSSGTFSRLYDFTDDRDNGVRIQAARMDAELDGMATGLTTAILKDGSQTTTAVVPFAYGISIVDNQSATFGTTSDYTLQYDETTRDSLFLTSNVEGAAFKLTLAADQGDDASDEWQVGISTSGVLTIGNDIASAQTYVSQLTLTPHATVASSTTAVLGNLTVGGSLSLGSAVIAEAELEMLDGITAGTVIASKALVADANIDITGGRNITITGELDAATGDFSGDVDVDGTLEADAITVNGTALATVIAGTTVTNATNSAHVLVTDNESTNEENLIAFVEGATSTTGNVGLEMDGNFAYNPSTGTVSATVFKGNIDAVDGDFDGTLEADAITIGGTAVGSIFSPIAGGTGILTTGALNAGSITSGFGAIDNGASAITTTGVGSFGSLDISGDIDVDGTTNLDVVDIDGAVDMASTALVTGVLTANGGAVFNEGGADVDFRVESDTVDHALFVDGETGSVGIGTSIPATFGKLALAVAGTTTPTTADNVKGSSINLYAETNGATTNSTVGIFGWQGSAPGIGSGIGFSRENGSDWGSQIRFYTHPTTTSNISDITEAMRISSAGDLSVGHAGGLGPIRISAISTVADYAMYLRNDHATTPYGIAIKFLTEQNDTGSSFLNCVDGAAARFNVTPNGGLANYQANDSNLSDELEKNQFGQLDSTSDCVRSWEIVKYLYKDEDQTNPHKYGVIAQQIEEHCPEVITNWVKVKASDEVLWSEEDEDIPEGVSVGDVKAEAVEQVNRMAVKEQQMFWMLVKSHQEALDTITALEARITALERA